MLLSLQTKKKKTENSGYDFIRGHVISVAFCSMFLNKTKKNYHNLSCADTLFITFFLKWRASHFSKTNLLCVRANATHWIHNLQNPLYRQFMDSFTKLSTDSIQSRSSPPPRPWLMDTGWYRSALMCKLLRFQTPPPPRRIATLYS